MPIFKCRRQSAPGLAQAPSHRQSSGCTGLTGIPRTPLTGAPSDPMRFIGLPRDSLGFR